MQAPVRLVAAAVTVVEPVLVAVLPLIADRVIAIEDVELLPLDETEPLPPEQACSNAVKAASESIDKYRIFKKVRVSMM